MDDTEYYRLKDLDTKNYIRESYNTQDLNSIKRVLLTFFSEDDRDDISKLSVGDILNIEGLGIELESSYEPFEEVDNIARFEDEDTEINVFPEIKNN